MSHLSLCVWLFDLNLISPQCSSARQTVQLSSCRRHIKRNICSCWETVICNKMTRKYPHPSVMFPMFHTDVTGYREVVSTPVFIDELWWHFTHHAWTWSLIKHVRTLCLIIKAVWIITPYIRGQNTSKYSTWVPEGGNLCVKLCHVLVE